LIIFVFGLSLLVAHLKTIGLKQMLSSMDTPYQS
jgi:hypothetical protein